RYAGRRFVAFAGIGRPRKFFASLRALGAAVVFERGFADHHPFLPDELESLAATARREGAELATTAKDAMRLCGVAARREDGLMQLGGVPLHVLEVRALVEDGER